MPITVDFHGDLAVFEEGTWTGEPPEMASALNEYQALGIGDSQYHVDQELAAAQQTATYFDGKVVEDTRPTPDPYAEDVEY